MLKNKEPLKQKKNLNQDFLISVVPSIFLNFTVSKQ